MKKIYNKPQLNSIVIEENVIIATSTVYNFGFDGAEYDGNIPTVDWDWNETN